MKRILSMMLAAVLFVTMFSVTATAQQVEDKKFVIDVLPEKITIYNDKELVEEILKD